MIKEFVEFLQRNDVSVKALVFFVGLGAFHPAVANDKNTVGHTQAVQAHLSTLNGQRNDMVAHLAFRTEIPLEESAGGKHTVYGGQNHRQFLLSGGVFFEFLDPKIPIL